MATSCNGNELIQRKQSWEKESLITKFGVVHSTIHTSDTPTVSNKPIAPFSSLISGEDDDPVPEELED